ncbi:MAG: tRNA dihydrouridine synthase DusB [Holosporales bacterium]|jgi:tRNA-dihydrouridine synthase B|nr:tRNA dihydrouridine synthase DusB [Holosporales bacterium]
MCNYKNIDDGGVGGSAKRGSRCQSSTGQRPVDVNISLGQTALESRVIVAPMAGVTDLPFRKIVRQFGNFLMFSEMVASQAVIRNVRRTHKMMDSADDDFTSVQIVGADPIVMAEAAKLSFSLGAKFIDINMGCPVRKVVKSESGSALMKNEKLAAKIIESVVNAVPIPVTLKIRLGWDLEHKNAQAIAKIAKDLGIKMVSVHARTRSQLFSGSASWIDVLEVKQAVGIPIIVNGDIVNVKSAGAALCESEADGVMVGRGVLGNPWLLRDIHNFLKTGVEDTIQPTIGEKMKMAAMHLEYMFEFYDEQIAIKLARKVLMYYFRGLPNATKLKQKISQLNSTAEAFVVLDWHLQQTEKALD